jgi:ATP-dependent DNA ligase
VPGLAIEAYGLGSRAFHDGEVLFESVRDTGLEGVVAKKLSQPYRPGERRWINVKNRDYWRFRLEREATVWGGQQPVRKIRSSIAGTFY